MHTDAPLTLDAVHAALEALTRRVGVIDAWIEGHDLTHDRQGERRDGELARLREQLYDAQSDVSRLEDELRRAGQGHR